MIYLLSAVLLALSVSFLCSLLESSTLSLRPADVSALRERSPELGALWEKLRKNIEQPIAAILILNTFANTIGATIAGAQFINLAGPRWLPVFSLLFALVIIQWGEILPKTFGVRYRLGVASFAAQPLAAAIQLFRPIMWLTKMANRPFEQPHSGDGLSTVEEIRQLASYASFSRDIDRRQENIITKSVQLHEVQVGRIMVPRTKVMALEADRSVAELLAMVREHGYSRIPVYRSGIDDIVGVVLVKDVLFALHDGHLKAEEFDTQPVSRFMSEPVFVPESATVADMMATAAETKAHMMIVLDEHGGFSGVVTLEDALEEFFGEILDEHDRDEPAFRRVARARWVAAGGCPTEELSAAVGVDLVARDGEYGTLSGLLMLVSGKVPQTDEVIVARGLRFRILEATPTVPLRVEITRPD